MVKKLEEFAASSAGKVWAQLSLMISPILFAGLMWFVGGYAEDAKRFDQAQLTSLAAIHSQLTAFIARADGDLRTQAAIDAAQSYRIEQNELGLAAVEADVRMLLLWQRNVLSRGDPG